MARSQNSFIKKKKAEKKKKKQEEKFKKKLEKKNKPVSGDLKDMIAHVDDFGNIISGPPEDDTTETKQKNQTDNKDENRNS